MWPEMATHRPSWRDSCAVSARQALRDPFVTGPVHDQAMERCDFCELPIGGGCACSLVREARNPRAQDGGSSLGDAHFPGGTILISPRGVAHRPGCLHQSDSEIKAPLWGWIPEPDPQLWRRLGGGSPARATHGNTERVATRRCQSCDS